MIISLIAAMTPGRAIGAGGRLPWHLPADLKRFKAITTGHTIIMGRKTFESIGKALPHRDNLILSRACPAEPPPGTTWFTDLHDALAHAKTAGEKEAFIIGGGEVYAATLPLAHKLYLTIVHLPEPPEADAWFPKWQMDQWQLIESLPSPEMDFLIYQRR